MEIGKSISLSNTYKNIQNIVIAGMGGSAIGGDIAKTLTNNELIANRKFSTKNITSGSYRFRISK